MANEGSRFIVDLGDFKLPPLVYKQVEAEIRAIVLRALAENGFGGDPRVPQARVKSPIWDDLPGNIAGLWPGYPKPPDINGSGDAEPLTARDHTLIMSAVMEHPMHLLRYLPKKFKSKTSGRPSGKEVLQAALQVEQIDDYVKDRIRKVLDILPKIEESKAALPESLKKAVDDLRRQLTNKTTVEEKRSVLRNAGLRNRHREDGLAEGMDVAALIFEDGLDSIYTPDHSFYKLLQEGKGSSRSTARDESGVLSDISDNDGVGGALGGLIGSVAGGIGAGPGAVAGAAGASAGAAVSALIDAISEWWDSE